MKGSEAGRTAGLGQKRRPSWGDAVASARKRLHRAVQSEPPGHGPRIRTARTAAAGLFRARGDQTASVSPSGDGCGQRGDSRAGEILV